MRKVSGITKWRRVVTVLLVINLIIAFSDGWRITLFQGVCVCINAVCVLAMVIMENRK